MPAKLYRTVLNTAIQQLGREEEEARRLCGSPFLDGDDEPESVGLMFAVVTYGLEDRPESSTVKFFKEANLNPYDPLDWSSAVAALTKEHYHRRKLGRRPRQDAAFVETLRKRIGELVSAESPLPNDHRLAQLCLEKLKDQYPNVTTVSGFTSLLDRHGIKATDFTAP
jgi:hypothetical protein